LAPFGRSRVGKRQHRGMGLASGGQAAASRAEGGWWRRSRGSQEADLEGGATGEVRDEAAVGSEDRDETIAGSEAGDEMVACFRAGIEDGKWQ
jgi:hypothetical protein